MSDVSTVGVAGSVYPIIIGTGLLGLGNCTAGRHKGGRPAISRCSRQTGSDSKRVGGQGCRRASAYPKSRTPKPEGPPVLGFIWEVLGRIGIHRKDAVVSLGGGAATDVAGFAAATWLPASTSFTSRGTLPGMVDGGRREDGHQHRCRKKIWSVPSINRLRCSMIWRCWRRCRNELVAGMARS